MSGPNTVSSSTTVQFHLLSLNWYWHSSMPTFKPRLTGAMWSLCRRHKRRCPAVRPGRCEQSRKVGERMGCDHCSKSWRAMLLEQGKGNLQFITTAPILWVGCKRYLFFEEFYNSLFLSNFNKLNVWNRRRRNLKET